MIVIMDRDVWQDIQFQKGFKQQMKRFSLYAGRSYGFYQIDRIRDAYNQSKIAALLQEERNQTLTARKLNMHRNTLIKQMKRIIELTGIDLDDYKTRFHLLISYLLHE